MNDRPPSRLGFVSDRDGEAGLLKMRMDAVAFFILVLFCHGPKFVSGFIVPKARPYVSPGDPLEWVAPVT